MKFKTASSSSSCILSVAAFFVAARRVSHQNTVVSVSANTLHTGDLCTKRIENSPLKLRLLKPSECDPTGRVPPRIGVGGTEYGNDEAHFVIGVPNEANNPGNHHRRDDEDATTATETATETSKQQQHHHHQQQQQHKKLLVYLPGTTSWPAVSSCLLESVSSVRTPTIGLTYAYLSRPDASRNERCSSSNTTEARVECLSEQHEDAIDGGTYGADRVYKNNNNNTTESFWDPVDPRDSISGRLGRLLAKLDQDHPSEGWGAYYYYHSPPAGCASSGGGGGAGAQQHHSGQRERTTAIPRPAWIHIAVMGHSQGAGHAAYLAQTRKTAGAALLSGPQDDCTGCPPGTRFWIDGDFKTQAVTALAHGDASEDMEPSFPTIRDNWSRMARSGTVSLSHPLEVAVADARAGGDGRWDDDACKKPIVSMFAPSRDSSCIRRGHCSTALDDSAPTTTTTTDRNGAVSGNSSLYVYDALGIWPGLAEVSRCRKSESLQ